MGDRLGQRSSALLLRLAKIAVMTHFGPGSICSCHVADEDDSMLLANI